MESKLSSRGVAASRAEETPSPAEPDLARARDGDTRAFDRLVGPLRRELHAHCYRMLGSAHDADDAMQQALLRAWQGLPGFEGRSSLRTWLYAITTRTCLDLLRGRDRRALPMDLGPASDRAVVADAPSREVSWLGPYPDLTSSGQPTGPEARYEQRESVELAFVAALQHLPGNQRAALLLADVLGFSAAEIAALMKTSTTSVNSALARARRLLSARTPAISQQRTVRTVGDAKVRKLVAAFSESMEQGDVAAFVALLTEDVTWSMPPLPHWYQGKTVVTDFAEQVPFSRCGAWTYRLTAANGQPATGCYRWDSELGAYSAWCVNVLTLGGDRIAGITSFIGPEHFTLLDLPLSVSYVDGPDSAGRPDSGTGAILVPVAVPAHATARVPSNRSRLPGQKLGSLVQKKESAGGSDES